MSRSSASSAAGTRRLPGQGASWSPANLDAIALKTAGHFLVLTLNRAAYGEVRRAAIKGVNNEANNYEQILVPLDGTMVGHMALPHAVALARATSSRLILLHVTSPQAAGSHACGLSRAEGATAMHRNHIDHRDQLSSSIVTWRQPLKTYRTTVYLYK